MKLYETDSYTKKNETIVTSCETVDGKVYIKLEDTIFFPEEGGQYADTGYLLTDMDKVRVADGQLKSGEIYYLVDKEIPVGSAVSCELDWGQRFMRMQHHTGEHILTGVIHNKYGYNNVGFHLSDESPMTLDLDGMLSPAQIAEMEFTANEIVYANLPVTDSYPTKDELECIVYRSKIEIDGQVRLITVGDKENPVDICACCAPHVAHTGEVGLIKVISSQKYKGGIRLSVLCGERAFLYFQEQMQIMNLLSKTFSTSMDKVYGCVQNQMKELADLKYKVAELTEKSLANHIHALPDTKHACLFVDAEVSGVTAKNSFNTLAARFEGYVGLFIGNDEKGYRFNAGSTSLDARELMSRMKEALDAKGGGSSEMVQGRTSAGRADIEALFAELGR